MSWFLVGATVVSVASSALASKQQQRIADRQVEQARMDMVASTSATKQAEEDAKIEESFDLAKVARELLASRSTAVATQANNGVAGITQERQLRNIDFQNSLDVGIVKRQADQTLIGIRNSGFSNNQQHQNTINTAKANRPSNTDLAVKAIGSGVGTYLSVGGSKSKPEAKKGIR